MKIKLKIVMMGIGILMLSTACSQINNKNNIPNNNLETMLDKTEEMEGNVQNKKYETIFTCKYPDSFKKERKKILSFLQGVKGKTDKLVILEKDGDGFKQTLSSGVALYYGKIKDGRPEGLGAIIVKETIEEVNYKEVFVPYYVGYFEKGKYEGYGIEFNLSGIDKEGEYKKGKRSGKAITYYSLHQYIYRQDDNTDLFNYWEKVKDNDVVVDFPVFNPSISFEGEMRSGKAKGKNCKEFYPVYRKDSETGEYIRTKEEIYGVLRYEGEMADGEYSGEGKEYYSSGKLQYKGELKKGRRNGKGILYEEDGTVQYKGKFKDGNIK